MIAVYLCIQTSFSNTFPGITFFFSLRVWESFLIVDPDAYWNADPDPKHCFLCHGSACRRLTLLWDFNWINIKWKKTVTKRWNIRPRLKQLFLYLSSSLSNNLTMIFMIYSVTIDVHIYLNLCVWMCLFTVCEAGALSRYSPWPATESWHLGTQVPPPPLPRPNLSTPRGPLYIQYWTHLHQKYSSTYKTLGLVYTYIDIYCGQS